MAREAITKVGQAKRSGLALLLSGMAAKAALLHPFTAPFSAEIGLVSFFLLTQLGMLARDLLLPKLVQNIG